MSKKLCCLVFSILVLALAGSAARADLKLVENFESLVGESPDDQACSGVLGGTWDTQSNGTGNIDLVSQDGSRGVSVLGHSGGNGRAIGFNGITNTIENTETGILFFRFQVRSTSRETRTFMGLISDTSDDPINSANTNDPMSIPAGFSLVHVDSDRFDIATIDQATVLKAGLSRGSQWYNMWMVVNNVADTFDLYISEVEGPAGEAALPNPEDLVAADISFTVATTEPLVGMILSNPSGTSQADKIYFDEVWWDGDQGLEAPAQATKPSPAKDTVDVATDVVLSWNAPESATSHTVYFGTSFSDVADATVDDARGVLLGTALDVNSVSLGRLALDRTYYWRVDEVDAQNPQSPFKGSVWSFTTEPVAFDLMSEHITVTSSGSTDAIQIAENTLNGSGLDTDGGHGVEAQTMWLSSEDPNGAWIEYVFDMTYRMYDMKVWNHNTLNESSFGFGMKDVEISYSADGTTWTPVDGVTELPRATGQPGTPASAVVDLTGVVAGRIRIQALSNWGGLINKFGLSEVRFMVIPTAARLPQPESGSVDLDPAAGIHMRWRAGRDAAQHVLYLGQDEQAVMDGAVSPVTLTEAQYLAMDLNVNSVYYWRVDEVNETEAPAMWPGELWDFSTVEFLTLDDFEDYNNLSPDRPFQTWVDGYGYSADEYFPVTYPGNGTGAGIGHDIWSWGGPHFEGDIMERFIRHGGNQSMPFYYSNGTAPFVSETTRVFATAQDWTGHGVDALGVWTLGFSAVGDFSFSSSDQTYSVTSAGGDIWGTQDTCQFVYKKLSGNGEIVARVESVDPVDPWSKAGVMVRQGLNAGGVHGFVAVTPGNGVTFVVRASADGDSQSATLQGLQAPVWVKLVREGDYLSAFTSADAKTWAPLGIPEPVFFTGAADDIYIGMAVSSHEGRDVAACEAVFSNVAVTGNTASGAFTQSAAITGDPVNSPERLYAVIKDAAGKQVEVELDPAGTVSNGWALGQVDLAAIAGTVNLASVRELTMGVGDGTAGSDGLVFIDDVILFRAE
ncbi:MAG: discoidin domain-containing protein [Phycisphaerae bacterium]|nr:discoidin domain-containing protein [Phycisphaerae bacterium]